MLCVLWTRKLSFPVCGTSPVPVLEVRSVPCDVRLQQVLLLWWPTFWSADPYTRLCSHSDSDARRKTVSILVSVRTGGTILAERLLP